MTLADAPPTAGRSPQIIARVRQWWSATIRIQSFALGCGLSVLLGLSYMAYAREQTASGITASAGLVLIERQDIVSSVKAAGTVTFASEQTMRFNQRGTVRKVNVKEGDTVKQGQVIAELDMTSVLSDIRQAELGIGASSLQLTQLQADKQKTVQDVQNDLIVSEQKLPADLESAVRTVAEKQSALDQAKLDLQKQQTIEVQSLSMTAGNALVTGEKLLDSFYQVLTNDASARPADVQYHDLIIPNQLYADQSLKNAVVFAYLDSVTAEQAMRQDIGRNFSTSTDTKVILRGIDDGLAFATAVQSLGEQTYALLQGASTDAHDFTSSDLASARSTVSADRTAAATLLSDLQTAKANLTAVSGQNGVPSITLKAKQDAVTTAEHTLAEAQDNLSVLKTQTPGDLLSKKQAVDSTIRSTDISIQLKQNDIGQRAAALQKSRKILDDYRLVAPFNGVVSHIDYKPGDNLLDTGETEFLTIRNPDFIVVTVPLDQIDVVHVRQGMPAIIAFDALAGQRFDGAIDSIDSTPIQQSGVVSYNVLIRLPTPKGLTILSGMTATVEIETARTANALVVPNLALRYQGNRITVQKADGTSVPVEVGATDGRVTEITSGLAEGDAVMAVNIPTAQTQSSAGANAAQQLLRGINGGGGLGGGRGGAGGGGGGVRTPTR